MYFIVKLFCNWKSWGSRLADSLEEKEILGSISLHFCYCSLRMAVKFNNYVCSSMWFPTCPCMPCEEGKSEAGLSWGSRLRVSACQSHFWSNEVKFLHAQIWNGSRLLQSLQRALTGLQILMQSRQHMECHWLQKSPGIVAAHIFPTPRGDGATKSAGATRKVDSKLLQDMLDVIHEKKSAPASSSLVSLLVLHACQLSPNFRLLNY